MTKQKMPEPKPAGTSNSAVAPSEQTIQPDPDIAVPATTRKTAADPGTQAPIFAGLVKLMLNWRRRHQTRPETLYHYTNAQGLHGMVSSGLVWGTNVRFLNDPSEMSYAAGLIRNILAEEAPQLKVEQSSDEKKNFWDAMAKGYEDSLSKSLPAWTETLLKSFEDQGDAYLTCFCKNGDLLSQWRGYGSTGGGYALGFDARQIKMSAEPAGVLLRRVIYEPREQQEIIRNWIKAFFDLRRPLVEAVRGEASPLTGIGPMQLIFGISSVAGMINKSATNKELLEQAKKIFSTFLAECLICFKDPAYKEEREWRVIQFGKNREIKFRTSGSRLVPYLELALTPPTDDGAAVRLPLASITYGPTLEPAVTEKSLGMVLTRYQYVQPPILIKRSGIPFRTSTREAT